MDRNEEAYETSGHFWRWVVANSEPAIEITQTDTAFRVSYAMASSDREALISMQNSASRCVWTHCHSCYHPSFDSDQLAICSRYGLAIGATFAPLVRALIFLMYPIAKPIAIVRHLRPACSSVISWQFIVLGRNVRFSFGSDDIQKSRIEDFRQSWSGRSVGRWRTILTWECLGICREDSRWYHGICLLNLCDVQQLMR